ncbi:hypothetical protein [Paraburkholderia sacchari]|uniref:hypothetical protein n=1 Tax=Paraburkholderia sacchari TaxID=159450 RepID=UPI00054220B1|nr:hypothetical protein [Paraburkholderia sacchari]NLP64210.1 hypothetical protein [Paraburkholderia sacchari]
MNKIISMCAAVALTGCAAGVESVTAPNGKPGFLISCDGSADSWAKCYNAAIKQCGGPYDIVDKNETSTPTGLGPLVRRNLIVACKA